MYSRLKSSGLLRKQSLGSKNGTAGTLTVAGRGQADGREAQATSAEKRVVARVAILTILKPLIASIESLSRLCSRRRRMKLQPLQFFGVCAASCLANLSTAISTPILASRISKSFSSKFAAMCLPAKIDGSPEVPRAATASWNMRSRLLPPAAEREVAIAQPKQKSAELLALRLIIGKR